MSEHREQVLDKAARELWKSLEALLEDAVEEITEEHLGEYLKHSIPQEVIDLSKIYDTYLKDSVVQQIRIAEDEFGTAVQLRALLKGIGPAAVGIKLE